MSPPREALRARCQAPPPNPPPSGPRFFPHSHHQARAPSTQDSAASPLAPVTESPPPCAAACQSPPAASQDVPALANQKSETPHETSASPPTSYPLSPIAPPHCSSCRRPNSAPPAPPLPAPEQQHPMATPASYSTPATQSAASQTGQRRIRQKTQKSSS